MIIVRSKGKRATTAEVLIQIESDPQRWRERVTPTQVAASGWRNDQNSLSDSELVVVQIAVERVLRRQRNLSTTDIDVRHATEFNAFTRHTQRDGDWEARCSRLRYPFTVGGRWAMVDGDMCMDAIRALAYSQR